MVEESEADVVIHTAAISDIGICQKNPEASYFANVQIPVYLAHACKDRKLICFSSDQVYSGAKGDKPFTEDDVATANLYAEEKLEMENSVLAIDPNAVMLRATWMYDMPMFGVPNRSNLITMFLNAAITDEDIALAIDIANDAFSVVAARHPELELKK